MLSWFYPSLAAITSLLTIGVIWGSFKANVEALKEQVNRLGQAVDRQEALTVEIREEMRVSFAKLNSNGPRRKNGRVS